MRYEERYRIYLISSYHYQTPPVPPPRAEHVKCFSWVFSFFTVRCYRGRDIMTSLFQMNDQSVFGGIPFFISITLHSHSTVEATYGSTV